MSNTILLVFEGAEREPAMFGSLKRLFLESARPGVIYTAIYDAEIFQLWQAIKTDPDLDLVGLMQERGADNIKGICRSDVSEVYLFFDHEGHSHISMPDYHAVIRDMVQFYSEETENGKIYISYPMVEAIKDCSLDMQSCFQCIAYVDENTSYKMQSAKRSGFNNLHGLSRDDWMYLFWISLMRGKRLVSGGYDFLLTYKEYIKITQRAIEVKQNLFYMLNPRCVVVLSGIPFFIIDYCGEHLFDAIIAQQFYKACSFGCINTE
jgi:hypothetical protein